MEIRLLGPVEARVAGEPLPLRRRQERRVLSILALEPGRLVPVERLVDLLWGPRPPAQHRAAIQAIVSHLRSGLGAAGAGVRIRTSHGAYALDVEPERVDVHRFRTLVEQARGTDSAERRAQLLETALGLWRGEALADAADERLRSRLCPDLDELRLVAYEEWLDSRLELGEHGPAVAELLRLVDEYPLRERFRAQLMLALYRCGQRAEALQMYRQTRRLLVDELGLEPGPRLRTLEQQILADDPALAPSGSGTPVPRPVPAQLPLEPAGFTGREEQLRGLDALVAGWTDRRPTALLAVIAGSPGVGKTTLAVHWAHQVADQFPNGQLYVDLRGFDPVVAPVPAQEAVRRLLDGLNVPPQRIPTDPVSQIGLYRSILANKRVLVVLDNARDADQVRPLLPGAPGCLALVTSRNRLTGLVAVHGAHRITLDVFTQAEAQQLLTFRLGDDRVAAEPAAADALIQLCARLPLAIAVAAGHAASQPSLPLATLADHLHSARGRLDGLTGDDTATDIRTVFGCSYQALSDHSARLFRLLGLHPGTDISCAAAASLAGTPPAQVKPLLAELARAHLISEPAPGRYTLHDLLRAYATEQADRHEPETERHTALHRVLDHYLHTAYAADLLLSPHRDYRDPITLDPAHPGVAPENLTDHAQALHWFTAEHTVLQAAINYAAGAGLDTHTWQLAWTFAIFLDRQGRKNDLAATQQTALQAAQRLGNQPGQAVAHLLLGRAHNWLGHPDEAQTHLQHALNLYRKIVDRTGQARTHIDICLLLLRQGRFQEALYHGQQGLDLYRATGLRAGEPGSLSAIAWCRVNLGDHDQALTECQQALALSRRLDDRRGESWAWKVLGVALQHLGRHNQAITSDQHAIDLFRDLGDRYSEAGVLTHIGDTHHTTGNAVAARAAWQEALTIFDELDHPDAAAVRTKLHDLDRTTPGRPARQPTAVPDHGKWHVNG